mmetsp:Transcript_49767/g.113960  ORF Transcript_49767/g.113960 Transcript_49767/m.113960 type:complete len:458 (+) Transcript_49767:112-1485(+)
MRCLGAASMRPPAHQPASRAARASCHSLCRLAREDHVPGGWARVGVSMERLHRDGVEELNVGTERLLEEQPHAEHGRQVAAVGASIVEAGAARAQINGDNGGLLVHAPFLLQERKCAQRDHAPVLPAKLHVWVPPVMVRRDEIPDEPAARLEHRCGALDGLAHLVRGQIVEHVQAGKAYILHAVPLGSHLQNVAHFGAHAALLRHSHLLRREVEGAEVLNAVCLHNVLFNQTRAAADGQKLDGGGIRHVRLEEVAQERGHELLQAGLPNQAIVCGRVGRKRVGRHRRLRRLRRRARLRLKGRPVTHGRVELHPPLGVGVMATHRQTAIQLGKQATVGNLGAEELVKERSRPLRYAMHSRLGQRPRRRKPRALGRVHEVAQPRHKIGLQFLGLHLARVGPRLQIIGGHAQRVDGGADLGGGELGAAGGVRHVKGLLLRARRYLHAGACGQGDEPREGD